MRKSLSRCLHAALCLCLCAALLSGCTKADGAQTSASNPNASSPSASQEPQEPQQPQEPVWNPDPQPGDVSSGSSAGSGDSVSPDVSAPGESGESKETSASNSDYDYSSPVPEGDAVDNSYFDDAVFIGNSRTEGFMLYSGLTNAKSLTSVGLMVDTIFTKDTVYVDGKKMPVMDALSTMDFGKVYIMLGMNELGWVYGSVYQEYYGRIIDRIREINPDAAIYIQSILPVSAKKSDSDKIYNNPKINEYNELLVELAEEKQVYYVDVASAVADETGALPANAATDGVHLTPEYCKIWLEYLKTHTV